MTRLSDGRYESRSRISKKVFIVKDNLIQEVFLESRKGDKIEYLFEINSSLLDSLIKAVEDGKVRRVYEGNKKRKHAQ